MKNMLYLLILSSSLQAMEKPITDKPLAIPMPLSTPSIPTVSDLEAIPKTPEDKQYALTKAKIAAGVSIAALLITSGAAIGIQFAVCKCKGDS